jgi:hypothetical protein
VHVSFDDGGHGEAGGRAANAGELASFRTIPRPLCPRLLRHHSKKNGPGESMLQGDGHPLPASAPAMHSPSRRPPCCPLRPRCRSAHLGQPAANAR